MGYFDRDPYIADNDCTGGAHSARITFSAGHTDDRDRRAFEVTVTIDGKPAVTFDLHYEAARKLIRALNADMRADLQSRTDASEEES